MLIDQPDDLHVLDKLLGCGTGDMDNDASLYRIAVCSDPGQGELS